MLNVGEKRHLSWHILEHLLLLCLHWLEQCGKRGDGHCFPLLPISLSSWFWWWIYLSLSLLPFIRNSNHRESPLPPTSSFTSIAYRERETPPLVVWPRLIEKGLSVHCYGYTQTLTWESAHTLEPRSGIENRRRKERKKDSLHAPKRDDDYYYPTTKSAFWSRLVNRQPSGLFPRFWHAASLSLYREREERRPEPTRQRDECE